MMKLLVRLFVLLITIIVIQSCAKEKDAPTPVVNITPTPAPPPVTTSNSSPTLLMTLPANNISLSVGSYVKIEGIATDVEGLKGIVCVGSASDYYNYIFTDTIFLSGTNIVFVDSIFIPENISPGNLNLQFYAIDLMDSTSNIITRSATTRDNIGMTKNYISNSVNELDSIIVTVYRNSFNVVDSLEIFNESTGLVVGSIKDNVGFKVLVISVDDNINYRSSYQSFNLTTNFSSSFHYKIPLKNSVPGALFNIFRIGLDELDDFSIGGGKTTHPMSFTLN